MGRWDILFRIILRIIFLRRVSRHIQEDPETLSSLRTPPLRRLRLDPDQGETCQEETWEIIILTRPA